MINFLLGMATGSALIILLHFRKTILPDKEDFQHPLASLAEAWSELKDFLKGN